MIIINASYRSSYGYLIAAIIKSYFNDIKKEYVYEPLYKVDKDRICFQKKLEYGVKAEWVPKEHFLVNNQIIYFHINIEKVLKEIEAKHIFYIHRDGRDSVLSIVKSYADKNSRYGSLGVILED